MTETIQTLQAQTLPTLQARYLALYGEATKCPNKVWLAKKILFALDVAEAKDKATPETDATRTDIEIDEIEPIAIDSEPLGDEYADDDADDDAVEIEFASEAPPSEKKALTKMTVDELTVAYEHEVGRQTKSTDRGYLIWKIRQARKGAVPVGAIKRAKSDEEMKVLPLRMEATQVEELDAARERLGLKSRMDLFRAALHAYLLEAGEVRVAEMFAND